jgi:tetraacyldisaccharide 4'-kinase
MAAPAPAERSASRASRLEAWLQRQWVAPTLPASLLLRPLALLYELACAVHRLQYATGLRRARHAPRPVIVVGNLVAGGAGKTPTVLALVRQLQALGRRPGVISRGHGRTATGVQLVARDSTVAQAGDEPLLIHLRSKAPVAVGRDRLVAAQALCQAHPEVDLLIADDGLQHHALAREFQVLVFDDRGAANGRLLPAGPLRERLPRSVPPRTQVLYTHGAVSTPLPGAIGRRRLAGLAPLAGWWAGQAADPRAWAGLAGRPVWAAAGLARPEPFFTMLEAHGLQLQRLPLPDHASFDPLPWPAGAQDVVVTEKDAVKLDPARCGATRVWVATLDFDVPTDFARRLLQQLEAPAP